MKSAFVSASIAFLAFTAPALAFNPSSIKEIAEIPNYAPVSADEIVAPVPTLYRKVNTAGQVTSVMPRLAYFPTGICLERTPEEDADICTRKVNFADPAMVDPTKTEDQLQKEAAGFTNYNPAFVQTTIGLAE